MNTDDLQKAIRLIDGMSPKAQVWYFAPRAFQAYANELGEEPEALIERLTTEGRLTVEGGLFRLVGP